jgi:hypothetical protein
MKTQRKVPSASPQQQQTTEPLCCTTPSSNMVRLRTISNKLCCLVYVVACWRLVAEPSAYKPPAMAMAFLSQPSFTPTAKRLAVMDFHVLDCIGHLY